MLHHADIHVSDLSAARTLFDPVMRAAGLELRSADDDYVSYWKDGRRPSIGFIPGGSSGSGDFRLAFSVPSAAAVDAVAAAARDNDARAIDGPAIHPEYADDYYAVFFEDADGNKFEFLRDESVR